MKRLGIILCNLVFSSLVGAEVRGDPRVDSIASVSRSFQMFEAKFGRKPTTWGDLIDSGYLADPVLASAEKHINLRGNYLIFDKVVKIDAYGRIQTVLVASKNPTLEGEMSRSLKDGSIVRVPGRYLIVETESKEIQTAKYSEDELRRMFRSGGYDLDEIMSDLLNEIDPDSHRDSGDPGESGDDADVGGVAKEGVPENDESLVVLKGDSRESFYEYLSRSRVVILIVIFGIVACAGCLLYLRGKRV